MQYLGMELPLLGAAAAARRSIMAVADEDALLWR